MKSLIFFLFAIIFPLREVVDVQISIPTHQHDIFFNYSNDNFSQVIVYNKTPNEITAYIKNSNYFALNLDFRILPNASFIADLHPELRKNVRDLVDNCLMFKPYFLNISSFLEGHITYSDLNLPQDAVSVITFKKANCIGYANLVQVYLDAVGIKNRIVKGFYLKNSLERKKGSNGKLVPVPHRWLEIYLPNGMKFFYDPQHQRFSADYIAIREDVDFKAVKKFEVNLVKKSKKIVN